MNQTLAIALGAVCGIVGAIPSGVLFERARKRGTKDSVSVEAGLASTMASFLFLSAAIYVAHLLMGDYDLWFGCSAVVVFLGFWGIESVKGWKAAQGPASPGGKDE